jgi:hypothetical protein
MHGLQVARFGERMARQFGAIAIASSRAFNNSTHTYGFLPSRGINAFFDNALSLSPSTARILATLFPLSRFSRFFLSF